LRGLFVSASELKVHLQVQQCCAEKQARIYSCCDLLLSLLQQIIPFRKGALLLANQDVVRNLKRCFVSLKENIAGDVRVGVF